MKHLKSFGLAITLLVSCQANQHQQGNSDSVIIKNEAEKNAPKIVFINLSISKSINSENDDITLINTIKSDGKLKLDFQKSASLEPNHLLCSFLDENSKVIKQTVVENPISRYAEYSDENGTLQSEKIELEVGEFTLRTQFDEKIIFLRIEKISNKLELEVLKTIKL